ncbi:hypothetical protein [Halalkalicoccus subterraneus]|uniref:hypothetical protein n=1 Tax=Halalkalicoccus subterraneus TaxID=2675002 RepID=UPI000EFB8B15|nr:hypothetical protein [Halalkalicoccus subterraneus]
MKRSLPYVGTFMFLLIGLYFLAFPEALTDPTTLVSMGPITIAATLLIVGALRDSVQVGSRKFDWNVLVGVAFVLLGVSVGGSMVQSAFYESGVMRWILGICAIFGCGSLVWIGLQTAVDGRHVDLDTEPSNARVAGVVLFAVVSFLAGVAIWSIVL